MGEPIRILHIVTMMDRGGLETLLMNYYRNINKNIIQFDFLTHRKHEQAYEKEIIQMGGKIYKLNNLNPLDVNYLKELNDFFRLHKEYKIVHSHLDCLSGIPLKYAKKNNIPIRIAHAHSANQEKNIKFLIKLFYKTQIPYYATDLFACGNKAGRWMFHNNPFKQLNNAIDTNEFNYNSHIRKQYREKFNIQADEFIIGNIGSFKDAKNHLFLLEVFSEVYKKNKKSKLFLVGDGDLREKIEKKIIELKLQDCVVLLGVRNDINNILQMFDLFLLPSLYEGFPVSILEAQCSGLPCIISDVVSNECDVTGLIYQISLKSTPKTWAATLLSHKLTDRKGMREIVLEKGFDIHNNAKELMNYYLNKEREN